MTAKQFAQRLGVDVKQLDFEFEGPCKECRKLGGSNPPCGECVAMAAVTVREDDA